MYIVTDQNQEVAISPSISGAYIKGYATEKEAQKQVDYLNKKSKIKGWGDTFYCFEVKE